MSSKNRIKNIRRIALFIVPLYLVLAFGFYFSPSTEHVQKSSLSSTLPAVRKSEAESAIVARVIDGDTFDALIGEKIERIRIIGIDTPETVDPHKLIQCFGKEASMKAEELLPEGMIVTLVSDKTQGNRDVYGRLLRYVTLTNSTDVGEMLISEGYAREYTFNIPYVHQEEYSKAEAQAKMAGLGLWAKGGCDGRV